MKIVKFEGEIFENIDGYKTAIKILRNKYNDQEITIVIPIDSNTEKILASTASLASNKDGEYEEQLQTLEAQYLNYTRTLVPVNEQSAALSFIKKQFNELEKISKGIEILGECPENTLESILCYGPILSSFLFTATGKGIGLKMKWIDTREYLDNKTSTSNTTDNHDGINVFAGGITRTSEGNNHFFRKGGADRTMASLAEKMNAIAIDSWTGSMQFMTADQAFVKNAKLIKHLNYEEAMELSNYDTSIIYPPALSAIIERNIPIQIRSVNDHNETGTVISNEVILNKDFIKGISSLNNISLINIEGSGMIGIPGFAKKVFSSLNDAAINIILITQGSSEHSICVGVKEQHSIRANEVLKDLFHKEISLGSIKPIMVENKLSIVALVGDQMKSHPGVSGKMFSSLGKNGINIRAIAQGSSERNISAVIKTSELEKALNVLHESFFGNTNKEINLFIIGTGNVGKKLINQLLKQSGIIEQSQQLKINLTGIMNSRKMTMSQQNILSADWNDMLDRGEKSDVSLFTERMIEMNLRNSVLIDITANSLIPEIYSKALTKSISVVACNKIAASGVYEKYRSLKEMAVAYNSKFLFETNVGAALPIISTINDVIKSGDKIKRIDAVLSGTLNFVFNHYNGKETFASIVRKAQDEGYTEPDPRLDLSGIDVMRKIMILARESGELMEIDDVSCNSFLPESCMKGSVDDFYIELEKNEDHFKNIFKTAHSTGSKLKFVATLENGKASVGLQHIKEDNEMYHLYGKDNIVLITTDRYDEQPLVIKGAGAGADVTASGVFADILRTINN